MCQLPPEMLIGTDSWTLPFFHSNDKADSFRGPEGEETSVSRGLGAGNG